jgi:malate dehydrogenase (oxaloacetate-decarboxylating)(NADP+)
MEKNIYLHQLKETDVNMYYRLILSHMDEITPLIYTPTVGDACLQFSHTYRRPEGIVRHHGCVLMLCCVLTDIKVHLH